MTDHVGVPMIPDSVNVVVQVVEWVKVTVTFMPADIGETGLLEGV